MNRNQQRKFICIQDKEKKEPRENSSFGANSLKSSENFNAMFLKVVSDWGDFKFLFRSSAKLNSPWLLK